MLIASHIIPWSIDKNRRADPTNGLALCAFHDRAFDCGLFTFDESYRVLLSMRAKGHSLSELHIVGFQGFEGKSLSLPERFPPDREALRYHRESVFLQ